MGTSPTPSARVDDGVVVLAQAVGVPVVAQL
jgi:hypothetical protein